MSASAPRAPLNARLSLALANRYIWGGSTALSYVSRLALLGLILSVAILVIVLSVVNGFERELRERILGLLPHVSVVANHGMSPADVERLQALTGQHGIEAVAGVVQESAMLMANDELQGVNLLGVDAHQYPKVTALEQYFYGDTNQSFSQALDSRAFAIVLGQELAQRLQVDIGDRVLVVVASGTVTPAGFAPRQRRFEVVGIIDSQSQLDSQFVYINLDDAQRLLRHGQRIQGAQIRTADLFATSAAERAIYDALFNHPVRVTNWQRNFGNLYRAIAVQKVTMFVLLSFLVAVAAFNLISGLMMIVEQRQSDIAILRTMGVSFSTLLVCFALIGLGLGALGISVGILFGYLAATGLPVFYAWISETFSLNLMTQYFISYLPVDVRIQDLVNIGLAALGLTLFAVLPPALRAASAKPSAVLANE